nr:unnamed protein product [Callosobruchus analis]
MSQVTKIEYRAVIKFLTKEGLTPKIIKEIPDAVYGRSSPSYSVVKEWAKRLRIGQEFLEDDERSGQPVEVITENKVALVEELVLSDRCDILCDLRYLSSISASVLSGIAGAAGANLVELVTVSGTSCKQEYKAVVPKHNYPENDEQNNNLTTHLGR